MTITLSSVDFNGQDHKYQFKVDNDPWPFTLEDKGGEGTLDVSGKLLENAEFKKFLQDAQQVATEFRSRLPQELQAFHEQAKCWPKSLPGLWSARVCQGMGLSVDGLGNLVETSEPKPFKAEEKPTTEISFKGPPPTYRTSRILDTDNNGKADAVEFDTSDGVAVSIRARSIGYGGTESCRIFDTTRAGVEEFLKSFDDLFATKSEGCNL